MIEREKMARKRVLIVCLFASLLIIGCEESQKTTKDTVTQQLEESALEASGYGDSYLSLYFTPDDYFIAHDPSGGKDIYLTAVDKDGKPVVCHKAPMKMMLDKDGKAYLKCSHCGKMKPIAVKDGKVIVE